MIKHWKNLKYLARHKWFVFIAGRSLGVSFWRLLIHDWSKLTPSEWTPYADSFYGNYPPWDRAKIECPGYSGKTKESVAEAFTRAWLHHVHFNKHHWQYWTLIDDPESRLNRFVGPLSCTKALMMPEKYAREMVADWFGAGRAITGKWDAKNWYEDRKEGIVLHPETRKLVETLLA